MNGTVYEAYRHYKGVVNTHRTSAKNSDAIIFISKRDVLHVSCVGRRVNIGEAVQKKWPLGSTMTVFYDPEHPKRGFAEKVVVLGGVVGVVLLCVGLGLLAPAWLFYLIF